MAGVGDVPLYDQRGAPFDRVLGDRIDIRPEAGFHLAKFGLARVGVTGWFNF